MSYTPPLGNSVGLDLQSNVTPPSGGSINLEFDPTFTANLRSVGSIGVDSNSQIGFIVQNQRQNLFVSGAPPPAFTPLDFIEKIAQKVFPGGISSPSLPGQAIRYTQTASPVGIGIIDNPSPSSNVVIVGGFHPTPGTFVNLDFSTLVYTPPSAAALNIDFGAVGYSIVGSTFGVTLGDTSAFGLNTLVRSLAVTGISVGNTLEMGTNIVRPNLLVGSISIGDTSQFGLNTVTVLNVEVHPTGIAPLSIPTNTLVQRRLEIVTPTGIAPIALPITNTIQLSGSLSPAGIAPLSIPTNTVVQRLLEIVTPTGIAPLDVPINNVVQRRLEIVTPTGIAPPTIPGNTQVGDRTAASMKFMMLLLF